MKRAAEIILAIIIAFTVGYCSCLYLLRERPTAQGQSTPRFVTFKVGAFGQVQTFTQGIGEVASVTDENGHVVSVMPVEVK